MKIRLSGLAAAAALAMSTLVAASAQATVFDFSYTFAGGFVGTGVVEGTVRADGNTIDIFTVDFTINGQSVDPAVASTEFLTSRPLSPLLTDRSWISGSRVPLPTSFL